MVEFNKPNSTEEFGTAFKDTMKELVDHYEPMNSVALLTRSKRDNKAYS